MDVSRKSLYNAITDFSNKYGCHRFNDEENHREYMQLVDMCIDAGLIPKVNEKSNPPAMLGRIE